MRWFFLLLSLLYFLKTLAGVFKLDFNNKTKSRYRIHTYLGAQMSYSAQYSSQVKPNWTQIRIQIQFR